MTVETIPTIRYYYDEHPTEEDLMGDSVPLTDLIKVIVALLEWLFRSPRWFVAQNLNIYTTRQHKEPPIVPDVALFKGVTLSARQRAHTKSWSITEPAHPAPNVVFEIASDKTEGIDIYEKPARYAKIGVKEYYSYDPRPECSEEKRLRGWINHNGQSYEAKKDERGWIWSEELESWLAPGGVTLQLYDRELNLRLTEAEAQRDAKERALAAKAQALADAEAERAAKEQALAGAEAERAAKERALAGVEAERAAKERALADAEAERATKERAWAKLREHGVDLENL